MRKDGKRQIIWQLLLEYDIETAEDIQTALEDLLGDTIQEMMEAKMDIRLRLNVLLSVPRVSRYPVSYRRLLCFRISVI